MLLLFPRPLPLPRKDVGRRSSLALFVPLRDRAFRRIWLVGFCAALLLSQQTTTFAIYLTKLGGSPVLYGGFMPGDYADF